MRSLRDKTLSVQRLIYFFEMDQNFISNYNYLKKLFLKYYFPCCLTIIVNIQKIKI